MSEETSPLGSVKHISGRDLAGISSASDVAVTGSEEEEVSLISQLARVEMNLTFLRLSVSPRGLDHQPVGPGPREREVHLQPRPGALPPGHRSDQRLQTRSRSEANDLGSKSGVEGNVQGQEAGEVDQALLLLVDRRAQRNHMMLI